MNIKILIDRIVLSSGNFSPSQRRQLQRDIELELTYLLTVNKIPYSVKYGGVVSNLSVHLDDISSDINSSKLGQNIARSIYSELDKLDR